MASCRSSVLGATARSSWSPPAAIITRGWGNWQRITTGNSNFIGIEAENTGETAVPNADPWPAVQLDAYRRGVAAIVRKIKANAIICCGHREYALPVGRKPDPVAPTGDFDGVTEAAVRVFQRDNGLVPNGIVGPRTWATLVKT